ncbi:MAG TPA: hypothetical protein VJN18_11570 [Polyangiaceae bacterium]|nr:hypothetical protein [Polyangiaceae bacterium]
MSIINYPSGSSYELRVKDTAALDEFDVFVNGKLVSHVSDDEIQSFPIEHPTSAMAIAVHFQGADGGKSAIVDVTDPNGPKVVSSQTGLIHSYLLQA